MAFFRKKEQKQEASPEPNKANDLRLKVDRSLNDRGFLTFLENNASIDVNSVDFQDESSLEEINNTYEAYRRQKPLAKEVSRFISEEFKKFSANLESDEREEFEKAISVMLESKLGKEQEFITKISEQLAEYKQLTAQIATLEKQVGELDEFTRDERIKALEPGSTSLWQKFKNPLKSRQIKKEIKEKLNIESATIREELHKLKEQKNSQRSLDQIKDKLSILKQEIFGLREVVDLQKKIAERRRKEFDDMLASGEIADLNKAKKLLATAEKAKDADFNLFEGRTSGLEREINEKIEDLTLEEIYRKLSELSPESARLEKIQAIIKPYFTAETIGGKSGDEAKQFLSEALEQYLNDNSKSKASRIVVKRILLNFQTT